MKLRALLCALLLSSVGNAAPPQAQRPQATMNISGAVTVNGQPAPQPAAIFAGDNIQTGPDSFATILSDNLEITLPGNSSLTYTPGTLNLGCGISSVFTKAGKTVLQTAGGATITPTAADGFNKIEVSQGGGVATVRVVLGSALVTRNGQSSPLQAGSQVEIPGSPCTAPLPTPLSSSAGGGAAPAGQASGGSTAWIAPVVGAGAGGAIAAILLSRGSDETPVSPSAP